MGSNDLAARPPAEALAHEGAALLARRQARRGPARTLALVTWDALAPCGLLALAVGITGSATVFETTAGMVPAVVLLLALAAPLALLAVGAYREDARPGLALLAALGIAAGACMLVVAYAGGRFGWALDPDALALTFAGLPFAWILARGALAQPCAQRVLVVGSGQVADQFASLVVRHPDSSLTVVGCLDDDAAPGGMPVLGALGDLDAVLADHHIDRVVVTFSRSSDAALAGIIRSCDARGVEVDAVPRLFDLMPSSPRGYRVGELSLVRLGGSTPSAASRAAKRAFDIVASAFLLIVFSPVMAACAIAVVAGSGRPILFRQERMGRDLRPFQILKFRTMVTDADAIGLARIAGLGDGGMDIADAVAALKPANDARVTRVGDVLRRTSLDELPQLWNVLVGDMSIVGPRPLRSFECDALADWELRRQGMRPGITGLWQVTSRSDADWGERMRLDYRYVRHWSLSSDIRILARTVAAVLARKGAV